jgi:hypothetical protein
MVIITVPFLPVFQIREILSRCPLSLPPSLDASEDGGIIIGSVPEKTDMDTYKCLWIYDIKVIFLVVLKCNKIQKCILPCENSRNTK